MPANRAERRDGSPPAPGRREIRPSGERRSQREHQREETRRALVESSRSLIRSGEVTTMPAIARGAGVSEATAYRYFPDLLSILREGFIGVWPSDDDLRAEVEECCDVAARIEIVVDWFARNVLQLQGAVRSMIALTITQSDGANLRPGHRFTMIDLVLEPLADLETARRARLRDDLSIVISADALFSLIDLNRMSPAAAVESMKRAARALVASAAQ